MYSHRQTSAATRRVGNSLFNSLIVWMTGPSGSSAKVPTLSFVFTTGTPNRITDRRPFATSGRRNPTILFTPHLCVRSNSEGLRYRFWRGRDGMSSSASGLSVMKIGYISDPCLVNMQRRREGRTFVKCRSACHCRVTG